MKNIVYLLLLFAPLLVAQNNFEKGNQLYAKGNYAQAAAAYNLVLDANLESAELYYNLANCYYKLNKVAPAIYNYEKALVLKPKDPQTINNLKFAQKRTVDTVKDIPKVGFAKLLRDFTAQYHYNTWGYLSVGIASLFLLLFIGYYFSQKSLFKRVFFGGMLLLSVLLASSIMAAIFERQECQKDQPAIVFAEKTNLQKTPQQNSKTIITVHEGTKVFVIKTIQDWKKVQLTDGTKGWINQNAIKEVK
ncbi:tetratricopeptide repeat protein [Flavobacterium crassostreae]|uniref:BatE protein n=1 Tax=Flavobacterium crassostreae TaxID=1763534 RepID=A0A1B9E5S6_9FLAO|nr:tetratricopeptide repeat protein [Flavobacterium crassostreae]OCB77281.1 BatE protein [Flavobacterium crassostreae]